MFFVSVFLAPLSNSLIISFVVLLLMCFQEPLLLSLGISLDPAPADCIAAHPNSVSAFLLGSLSQPLRPFSFQHWSSLMSSSPSVLAWHACSAFCTAEQTILVLSGGYPWRPVLSLRTLVTFNVFIWRENTITVHRGPGQITDLLLSSFPTKELKTSIFFFLSFNCASSQIQFKMEVSSRFTLP